MTMLPTFMGFLMPRDGYGEGTIKLAQLLGARGWDVLDMRSPAGRLDFEDERCWWVAGRAVALCGPDWLPRINAEDGLVSFTMFEATKLPEGWTEALNRCRAVIVPCAWNAEVFRANGVTVPIHTAKWGIEGADWPAATWPGAGRPGNRPYTFLWSGTPDRRKGYDLAYRCFWQAFGKNPDVQLVMHFRKRPPGLTGARDPNVIIVEGLFDKPVLLAMLRRADAFVFPSRGEGWGSPPREAAAMGLPVIATNWGGLAEEIDDWALPLRVKGLSQAEFGPWDDVGEWAEPDPDHLVELYRWCYEHQDEAAAFGSQAACWLRQNTGWERTARAVASVMGCSWF